MRSGRGRRSVAVAALAAGSVVVAAAQAPPGPATAPVVRVGLTRADGGVTVESVPLEEYVARVVSGEGQPSAEPAAREALAIVVRTFALANQRRHRADGYDLCDTTHCQVLRPVLPAARAAASATSGQVLLDRGRPAFVFYSAHNGGTPALASEVWPGATDYAPGQAHDDACAGDPGWTVELARADVERALRRAGATGTRLRGLTVVDRTPSDRAGRLRADGFTPSTISAHELRMAVGRVSGLPALRSTAFAIAKTASGFRFSGVGYGHGVGLCVVGAGHRAARGASAAEILHAYFRDLRIGPGEPPTMARATPPSARPGAAPAPPAPLPPVDVPSPSTAVVPTPTPAPAATEVTTVATATDVQLTLPAADQAEQPALLALIRQTRDAVAARALVPPPTRLVLTAHPSMEAFGRATGQPWWVAATSDATGIDVAPIAELRRRGVLESTVRYEVASAVVAPHLAAAPAWVRVGAALFFSGPPGTPVTAKERVECPTDAEVLRPVSGGAQREAFARAERCVRRAVAQGRRLTTIR